MGAPGFEVTVVPEKELRAIVRKSRPGELDAYAQALALEAQKPGISPARELQLLRTLAVVIAPDTGGE